jgi:hypothetical protein
VVTVPPGVAPAQLFTYEYTPDSAAETATIHVAIPAGAVQGMMMQVLIEV